MRRRAAAFDRRLPFCIMELSDMVGSLEGGLGGKHQRQPFVAFGEFDSKRRGCRSVKPEPKAVIALEAVQFELPSVGLDFPGVVEHRHVEEAIGEDAEIG